MSTETIDHGENALRRVYAQYRNSEKLKQWLQVLAPPANELEAAFRSICTMLDIDTNVGEQLNIIGRLVGQPRLVINGVVSTDVQYRIFLRARIARNVSDATLDSIADLIQLITGVPVNRIVDNENMSFNVEFAQALPQEVTDLLTAFGDEIIPRPQAVRFAGFSVGTTPPLTASLPFTLSASCTFDGDTETGCANGIVINATVAGGDGNYTFTWSKTSGIGTISSGQGTTSITVVTAPGDADPDGEVGVFVLNVTDTSGNDINSNACTVTFTETPVFDQLSVDIAPPSPVQASCTFNPATDPGCQAVASMAVMISGGQGPYTQTWSKVSGIGSIVGSNTDTFVVVQNAAGESQPFPGLTGVYQVLVEDNQGTTATAQATVQFNENPDIPVVDMPPGYLIGALRLAPFTGNMQAAMEFNRNGSVALTQNGQNTPNFVAALWASHTGDPNFGDTHEVRFQVDSGVPTTGLTLPSGWVSLSTAQTVTLSRDFTDSGALLDQRTGTVEIRLAGTTTVLDTATWQLDIEITGGGGNP